MFDVRSNDSRIEGRTNLIESSSMESTVRQLQRVVLRCDMRYVKYSFNSKTGFTLLYISFFCPRHLWSVVQPTKSQPDPQAVQIP